MSRRRSIRTVLLVLCALAVAAPAQALAAPAPHAAAKRCKKGFVRKHGRCVCPKGRVRTGSRCVTRKKTAPQAVTPTTGSPSPGAPTTPGPVDGPPFAPPGRDLTGTDAANAILPFLANSTFTDCPAGIGVGCVVENRYGHFADGSFYYCRLTPTSGSDIINAPHPFQIIGADQKADGSWAVTLKIVSYGDQLVYYTWSVTTAGVATGLYWGPGKDPRSDPAEGLGPLQWVRGARSCSY